MKKEEIYFDGCGGIQLLETRRCTLSLVLFPVERILLTVFDLEYIKNDINDSEGVIFLQEITNALCE